jgi:hypothetical protein
MGHMIWGQIKYRGYFAPVCPLSNQIRTPPPAKHEANTIQKNGLTRAGFTRQNIESRMQIQIHGLDQDHVSN